MKTHTQLLVLGLLALAPACKRVEGAEVSSRSPLNRSALRRQ